MKNKVYIVNHTHWDREWYKTKDQYLMHLKSGVEYLINQFEQDRIKYFYFDGQTIVIEDLKLVLATATYSKFIELIKSGKIEVGPWFVLPDEGLIDEIGFTKNLEIGINICEDLGVRPSNVLYMPDTFGHNNKMPSIAAKFGLKHAIIHRGLTTGQVDCTWSDADASVKTIVLPTREGYYQTMFHHPNYVELFDKYVEAFLAGNKDGDVLVLNGCDHTFVPRDFKEKLDALKLLYKDKYEFIEANLTEFFEQTSYQFDCEISGEFRSASKAFLLPGVLSTRYYLKRDNREITDLLKYFYEPLANNLNLAEFEATNLENLWKKVIENHPHDSICGCSIDPVHSEMVVRSTQVRDNANTAIFELFNKKYDFKIEQISANNYLTNNNVAVFNHLDAGVKLVKLNLQISLNCLLLESQIKELLNGASIDSVKVPNFSLSLKQGSKVYYLELTKISQEEVLLHDYHTEPCYTYIVAAKCCANLELSEGLNEFEICIDQALEVPRITKLTVSDVGTVKLSGKNLNLVDYRYISDRGDSYNFDPVGEYRPIQLIENTMQEGIYYDTYTFISKTSVGEKLTDNRTNRSANLVDLEVITKVFAFEDKIVTKVFIDNKAMDIKVVAAHNNTTTLHSNVTLDVLERKQLDVITYDALESNKEVEYNQHPTLSEILLDQKVQVSHIGNNEVEIVDNCVLHTLYRATGDLSRRDLLSRRGGAGPSYEAPECQCIRAMEFDFLFTASSKIITNKHLELYDFKFHQYATK